MPCLLPLIILSDGWKTPTFKSPSIKQLKELKLEPSYAFTKPFTSKLDKCHSLKKKSLMPWSPSKKPRIPSNLLRNDLESFPTISSITTVPHKGFKRYSSSMAARRNEVAGRDRERCSFYPVRVAQPGVTKQGTGQSYCHRKCGKGRTRPESHWAELRYHVLPGRA